MCESFKFLKNSLEKEIWSSKVSDYIWYHSAKLCQKQTLYRKNTTNFFPSVYLLKNLLMMKHILSLVCLFSRKPDCCLIIIFFSFTTSSVFIHYHLNINDKFGFQFKNLFLLLYFASFFSIILPFFYQYCIFSQSYVQNEYSKKCLLSI